MMIAILMTMLVMVMLWRRWRQQQRQWWWNIKEDATWRQDRWRPRLVNWGTKGRQREEQVEVEEVVEMGVEVEEVEMGWGVRRGFISGWRSSRVLNTNRIEPSADWTGKIWMIIILTKSKELIMSFQMKPECNAWAWSYWKKVKKDGKVWWTQPGQILKGTKKFLWS